MAPDYGMSLDISKDLESDIRIAKQTEQAESNKDPGKEEPKAKEDKKKEKTQIIKSGKRFNWLTAFFILILISASLITMHHALDLPYYNEKAESVVEEHIRNSIIQQVSQAKDLLPAEKAAAAEEQYQEVMQSAKIEEMVSQTAESLKAAYRDKTGQNYLYAADPYHYYKLTKEIIEEDKKISPDLPGIYALSFKIMSFFNSSMTLKNSIFYLPVFFGILSVILFFFIVRRFTDDIAAFLAALFFVLNPTFFTSTRAGFIDTNSLNLLFSIAIIYLFLHTAELRKKSIFTALLIIPLVWMFKSVWSGWYYIVVIMIVYIIAFLLLYAGCKTLRLKLKKSMLLLFILLAAAGSIAYLFTKSRYMQHILSRFRFDEGFFPSGMSTVGELQGSSLTSLFAELGGYAIVIFVLCCIAFIIWTVIKELKAASKKEINFCTMAKNFSFRLFIVVYFVLLAFPPLFAQRFTIYFVPAFCMALGLGLYYAMPVLMRSVKYLHLNIKKKYLKTALVIIISILLFSSVLGELKLSMMTRPHMNDAIYNTALEIKYNSTKDAKINLWWDNGYLYQAIAERNVAFHGGSFEGPRLHWMSKALLTDDENLSAGIIRMLDCNSEQKAFKLVSKKTGKAEAIDTLHKILPMAKEEAESYINSSSLPEKLIDYTHCEPKGSFFIVGDELIRKMPVLYSYANFDFKKNYDKLDIKGMDYETAIDHLMSRYKISEKEAAAYSIELSQYDSKILPENSWISNSEPCKEENGLLICIKDFVINLSADEISYKNMHPPSFTFYNGTLMRKEYEDAKLKYAVVLIKEQEDYILYFVYPEFEKSMFFRMLYLDGKDLEHFELFNKEIIPQTVVAYNLSS
ncbi:MAG: STT3 domain-containing protein [Nanoarchaeota archaeon]|nr:STT3 domain-containing protein [Nanoarchaeota archaeon]